MVGPWDLPRVIPPPPRWTRDAACADVAVSAFYPEKQDARAVIQAARAICATCPVAGPCLQWALDHDEAGVWAGTTEEQRRQMRRQAA